MQGGMKNHDFSPISCFIRSPNWCKIEPYLLWKANRKPHRSFRMVPVWWSWVTSNPNFKVMILFKLKSLKKQYKIELYLQCRTNRKSHMVYRMELFSVTLNTLVLGSLHSFMLNISEMVRDTDSFSGMLRRTYPRPTMTRSIVWSLCDSWASCVQVVVENAAGWW